MDASEGDGEGAADSENVVSVVGGVDDASNDESSRSRSMRCRSVRRSCAMYLQLNYMSINEQQRAGIYLRFSVSASTTCSSFASAALHSDNTCSSDDCACEANVF